MPKIKNHKIGLSKDGFPLFFIKSSNENNDKTLDYTLEFITVHFSQKCQLLFNNQKKEEGIYTLIALKTESVDLTEYFLNILYFVLLKLPEVVEYRQLKLEVEKLVSLFNKSSKHATKTIQGLWAELLVIEQSTDPIYLVKSWHYNPTDKFDFNDGIDKIEIKSTSNSRRIHNFSLEQLTPNENSSLVITSVFAVQTGKGKTIFDLAQMINDRAKDSETLFIINKVIMETLGKELEKAFEQYFDYQLAIDSIAFFESSLVPRIESSYVKKEISNVHFDCDLSNIQEINKYSIDSLLHKSLINF